MPIATPLTRRMPKLGIWSAGIALDVTSHDSATPGLAAGQAREHLAELGDLINRAAYAHETHIPTRRGLRIAAMVLESVAKVSGAAPHVGISKPRRPKGASARPGRAKAWFGLSSADGAFGPDTLGRLLVCDHQRLLTQFLAGSLMYVLPLGGPGDGRLVLEPCSRGPLKFFGSVQCWIEEALVDDVDDGRDGYHSVELHRQLLRDLTHDQLPTHVSACPRAGDIRLRARLRRSSVEGCAGEYRSGARRRRRLYRVTAR